MVSFIKKYNNKDMAIIYKKNYEVWKKEGLANYGYFILFNGLITSNKLVGISGNALKLYIYLGIYSKNMTGEVWHSNYKIAKYFGKSERTIRNWMKELEELNLINRMQLAFNGESHTFLQTYNRGEVKK